MQTNPTIRNAICLGKTKKIWFIVKNKKSEKSELHFYSPFFLSLSSIILQAKHSCIKIRLHTTVNKIIYWQKSLKHVSTKKYGHKFKLMEDFFEISNIWIKAGFVRSYYNRKKMEGKTDWKTKHRKRKLESLLEIKVFLIFLLFSWKCFMMNWKRLRWNRNVKELCICYSIQQYARTWKEYQYDVNKI